MSFRRLCNKSSDTECLSRARPVNGQGCRYNSLDAHRPLAFKFPKKSILSPVASGEVAHHNWLAIGVVLPSEQFP